MTQAQLSGVIGLSQPRLSQIERGNGSFTAEQLIVILALFQLDLSEFTGIDHAEIERQNALVNHGAHHLRGAAEVPATTRFARPAQLLIDILTSPQSSRFVTALGPVLVWSIDELSLPQIQVAMVQSGTPSRLGWLIDNVLSAMSSLEEPIRREWSTRWRRADTVLDGFLRRLEIPSGNLLDPMDPAIRSRETHDAVWDAASQISRRWHVVSELTPDDFRLALENAVESR
ncbi:MAG: helix-turn-helix domain-containing protein [Myxococcales bacterium]|nr:helix-turn-helix domain-containing protein [Myxococcales bacterium]